MEEHGMTLESLFEELADAVAERVLERLGERGEEGSPWMKMAEAIEYTQIAEGTFRKMVACGEVPSHGRRTKRFHRLELDRALLGYASEKTSTAMRSAHAA